MHCYFPLLMRGELRKGLLLSARARPVWTTDTNKRHKFSKVSALASIRSKGKKEDSASSFLQQEDERELAWRAST